MRMKYLTKSKFKLALECPTKLFYSGKTEYANRKLEDSFLNSLADGGFQVAELAKHYFPGGINVNSLDYDDALRETNNLLKKSKVTIFEAAVNNNNLFVRVDILVKDGNNIDLIEVKSKSYDSDLDGTLLRRDGKIASEWKPYIYDTAFQKFVLKNAMPKYNISAYLMLADKKAICHTDGLNQKFKISKDEKGRKYISLSGDLNRQDISNPILKKLNVDFLCETVFSEEFKIESEVQSFEKLILFLANHQEEDIKIRMFPNPNCSGCEFKATKDEIERGVKCGFRECWKEVLGWTEDDFNDQTVLDIWNSRKKNEYISRGRIKMSDLIEGDIEPQNDGKPGISPTERQWLQVQKERNKDTALWIDTENLRKEMNKWEYPLHFIDFETSIAAIPFNKGRHPYEGIAFQFSHHIVYEDGKVEHKGQFLESIPGKFPNYDFIRKLKKELETDEGSIFRYGAHENTYLNTIYRQICEDEINIPDRNELCNFIKTISKSVKRSGAFWEGSRSMIDMLELVKRYYYDPAMKGSNSIKKVLPAILNSSVFLQKKYSSPIYGAESGISSLNYRDWTWVKYDKGKVMDPYRLLPNMFQDVSDRDFSILLNEDDEIRDGGAAMTAYGKMQFEEITDNEREELINALLRYCELDTLAMVMIYEGWKDIIN